MSDQEEREAIGKQLREARGYIGFRQQDVAKFLGIQRTAVCEMESGKRDVSGVELAKLARLYAVSIDRLLGLEQERTKEQECRELTESGLPDVERLCDHDRQEVIRFMDFLRHVKKAETA